MTFIRTERGTQPYPDDDAAILAALKNLHFDLTYLETDAFKGPNDRAAFTARKEHVARMIRDRDPNWNTNGA